MDASTLLFCGLAAFFTKAELRLHNHTASTTVQATAILNVPRPFLIKLLSEWALPYRKVGKH